MQYDWSKSRHAGSVLLDSLYGQILSCSSIGLPRTPSLFVSSMRCLPIRQIGFPRHASQSVVDTHASSPRYPDDSNVIAERAMSREGERRHADNKKGGNGEAERQARWGGDHRKHTEPQGGVVGGSVRPNARQSSSRKRSARPISKITEGPTCPRRAIIRRSETDLKSSHFA